MLYRLCIENVAIIEHVELIFEDGLNILTGETGAGKSILIDAVNLVLGCRTDKDLIRTGSDFARVEAVFFQDGNSLQDVLTEMGIIPEEELVVIREINTSGRSICRVNGRTVTIGQLRTLMAQVADIHGQQENHSLADPRRHRSMVDTYGGENLTMAAATVRGLHQERLEISRQLSSYQKEGMTPEQRIDILEYQIRELKHARVQPGEEEELLHRRKVLQNTERITNTLENAIAAIEGDDESSGAVSSAEVALSAIGHIVSMGEEYAKLAESLDSAVIQLQDVQEQLRNALEAVESDGDSLEAVEDRLHQLRQLSRKYACTIDTLPAQKIALEEELDALQHRSQHIDALRNAEDKLTKQWVVAAQKLTDCRQKAGETMCAAICKQMADLGMPDARMAMEWIPVQDGQTHAFGNEEGQFIISINPGDSMRPLNKVASGGELSRIMLAIKAVFAGNDGIQCQIFDEIDTGISGNMALVTAQKLAMISRNRQILCITHLPQIAAMADTHYRIEKVIKNNRAVTHVEQLPEEGRYQEVARLIGSSMTGETGDAHARGMVQWCSEYKSSM